MTIQDIESSQNFETDNHSQENIIKVVGVGGGGNNAISHMYSQNIRAVTFVNCNTDRQALNSSPVPTRILLGPNTTSGNGAGNKPEIARMAAEESAEEIAEIFDDKTKMVFITAGLGGGTGTGAAPVVARIAKEKGKLTIGIVTIPFLFEGEKKRLKALEGAEEMSKYVDALLVINNERLTEIYKDLDFLNAFHKADDTLTSAACSISDMITCEGHINLDFNDVNTTLKDGGSAIISTGYGEGPQRVTKAIEDALESPLLKDRDVMTSKRLLFNIYYNPKAEEQFMMSEADELTAFVNNIDSQVDVIWGLAFDETLGNKVKISILASGFDISLTGKKESKPNFIPSVKKTDEKKTAAELSPADEAEKLKKAYGEDSTTKVIKHKYIIFPKDRMDDDSVLELIERNPTYNRSKTIQAKIRSILESPQEQSAAPAIQTLNLPPRPANPDNPKAGTIIEF